MTQQTNTEVMIMSERDAYQYPTVKPIAPEPGRVVPPSERKLDPLRRSQRELVAASLLRRPGTR